ncbi:T9SS type A sorting domain-containing protein, partial [bacterium]|nr:T9SS type A sorting domain-containing protein [bacterium]
TWTMYRHDRYRTGNLMGGPAKVAEGKVSVPGDIAIAAAPNPFNSQCRIKIYSPAVPERVVIADISGRTVAVFRTGEIVWEPKNLPAGVYILSAVVGGKSCTRKLMYLK